MIRLIFTSVLLMFFSIGCLEDTVTPNQQEPENHSIIRNLPTQDREFLLEPLEAALSDVRDIIDNDPSYFESTREIRTGVEQGVLRFKLNGKDTVMIEAKISTGYSNEIYKRYWDDAGVMFIAEASIEHVDAQGKSVEIRTYRLFYEEKNQRLSAYTRVAFGGEKLPEEWVTDCITDTEERYILRNW